MKKVCFRLVCTKKPGSTGHEYDTLLEAKGALNTMKLKAEYSSYWEYLLRNTKILKVTEVIEEVKLK